MDTGGVAGQGAGRMPNTKKGPILMEKERYTEQDWKLFRSRIPQWQEDYMGKLNAEYAALLAADGKASDKFWELEKRIRKDRQSVGVCVEMRRSKLIWNLIELANDGVISRADLDGFSEGLLEILEHFCFREESQS